MFIRLLLLSALGCILTSFKPVTTDNTALQKEVQTYLDKYNAEYQRLTYADQLAQWQLNVHIVEGDTMDSYNASKADDALSRFTGSVENIKAIKKYMAIKKQLTPLQVRQLDAMLYLAGNNPATAGDVVKKRIDLQNAELQKLYGFKFTMGDKEVTPNQIDEILRKSTDNKERTAAWESSKQVGAKLKDGLAQLRDLRNKSVAPLDYHDYFAYMVSQYGMSSEDLLKMTRSFIHDVWPIYRELHTWARYHLADQYHQPVPDYIPAQWLPNRWAQDWSDLVEVKGLSIDDYLQKKGAEWIPKESEKFYMSIGFDALDQSFWKNSSLYPLSVNAGYKKNTHASAWHLDLNKDIRSLQSIEPNTRWWGTCLHEFGHVYYFRAYSNPNVPIVLRNGANRAYHEAFGTMMGLASMQKPFLQGLGMIDANATSNDTLKLLKDALQYIVMVPWAGGTMPEFEHSLYAENLPEDKFNARWWEIVKQVQGIVPPSDRGEQYCDAATKTHITDDPAAYYDYCIANVLLFQAHTYIADSILHQDPHATNYYGNKAVGDFLKKIMTPGASVDWREHLRNCIHSDLSAKPMVDYFAPLMVWLKKENAGRKYSLPEKAPF